MEIRTRKISYLLGFISGAIVGAVLVKRRAKALEERAAMAGEAPPAESPYVLDPFTVARMNDHNVHVRK